MAQLSCHLKETERNYFRAAKLDMSADNLMKEFSLDHAMKLTIESMDRVQLYLEDGSSASFEEPARKTLELKVRRWFDEGTVPTTMEWFLFQKVKDQLS